jgi:acetyl esterase/lipase
MKVISLLLACFLFPVLAVTADAQTSENNRQLENWLKRFPQADTNGDGVLTRDEAEAYRNKRQQQRSTAKADRQADRRSKPTAADVRYGKHARNVFDLWLPDSGEPNRPAAQPLPVFVYFHGGGFVAGDKSRFDPTPFLDAGFATVSANYRFVDGRETLSPAPLLDSARVIQYLRLHAAKWNLDPKRIAVSGGSAGGVISMWIGYHDDLADPSSEDPVARQSSRVTCIAPINGPSNLDPKWINKNMGGPPSVHSSFPKLFGAEVTDFERPAVQRRVKQASPWEHVSANDPPTLLVYLRPFDPDEIPLPEDASQGLLIHHPYFGVELKKRLDAVNVESEFHAGSDPRGLNLISDWVSKQFAAVR